MLLPDFDFPIRIFVLPRRFLFKRPAVTSHGAYTDRLVWYVAVTSPLYPRHVGLGECAPLPDLSADFSADYEARLRRHCQIIEQNRHLDVEKLRHESSILFGIETAWLSFRSSLSGHFLRLFDNPFTRGEEGIPINGLVWMGSFEEMAERMEEKLAQGFRCVKLKIGAIDFGREMELLRGLRQRFPADKVELRVDANGAFPPEKAMERLNMLAEYQIHSIEQPIRAGQWERMSALCRQSPIPVALDEELIGVNDRAEKIALLDRIHPAYLVLKPSLHGGLEGAEEWMTLAAERDIPYWVTSALETNVGLNVLAQWTAETARNVWETTVPSGGHCHELPSVHGLGTGQLFVKNYGGTTLEIAGDRLWNTDREQREFRKDFARFKAEWESGNETFSVRTSGSTGAPKMWEVRKEYARNSAWRTCRFLRLSPGDTALVCMPLSHIAARMQAIRTFVFPLSPVLSAPSSRPFRRLSVSPFFAAMTPHQVWETLRVPREKRLLFGVKCLLLGGGSVSEELRRQLKDFKGTVWSSYGMTETLSHIALQRINGKEEKEGYQPFSGVGLSVSQRGCLVITDPLIGVKDLETNDIVRFLPNGNFVVEGRADNTVCSGGLKFQIEDLEQRLAASSSERFSASVPFSRCFAFTAVPDEEYGEVLTLLYSSLPPDVDARETSPESPEAKRLWQAYCRRCLHRYEVPKHYFFVPDIPLTPTGKPDRAAHRALAGERVMRQKKTS